MTMARTSGHWLRSVESADLKDINTTPLIDVMLVLLIMFIITLPPTTHAVKIDVPTSDCRETNTCPLPSSEVNHIYVAPNDTVSWNGQAVSFAQLAASLKNSQTIRPIPELQLQPDADARHEVVLKVIRETKYAKVRNFGIIGNENYTAY